MKIAIQGIKGSFHHQAAQKIIGSDDFELVECKNFRQVFDAVKNNLSDFGLVAIENNLHGSINDVYRLLQEHNVWISKDHRMHISQNLISHVPQKLEDLQDEVSVKAISHPVALAQVEHWLDKNLPNATRQEYADTAASVKYICQKEDPLLLAVASSFASDTYGANIIAKDIQDDQSNYTRFILISRNKTTDEEATHCSVILTTDHKAGALLRCLQVFDKFGCNLTKLDSQPIPGDDQHYSFFIDYELTEKDQKMLDELKQVSSNIKILGKYSRI